MGDPFLRLDIPFDNRLKHGRKNQYLDTVHREYSSTYKHLLNMLLRFGTQCRRAVMHSLDVNFCTDSSHPCLITSFLWHSTSACQSVSSVHVTLRRDTRLSFPVYFNALLAMFNARNRLRGDTSSGGSDRNTHELPRIVDIRRQAISKNREEVSFGSIHVASTDKLGHRRTNSQDPVRSDRLSDRISYSPDVQMEE